MQSWLSGTTVQSASTLNLGNEPMGPDPLPLPGPFSLTLFLSVLFRARLPFLGRDHPLKGGLPELQLKVQPAVSPAERDQSGTSFSATLRPGWALANPRLSKSRGSFPPPLATPGLVASAVTAQVCAVRLSGYPPVCCPMPAAHCRTARPFIPSTHPILPPVPITSHFPSNQ